MSGRDDDLDAVDIVAYHYREAMRRQIEVIHASQEWITSAHVQRGVECTVAKHAADVAAEHGRPILAWLLFRFYHQLRLAPLLDQSDQENR